MPVQITDITYTPRYTTNNSAHLLGNVGDWVKCIVQARVSIFAFAAQDNLITVNDRTITRISGSFLDDGFRVGQIIEFRSTQVDTDGFTITTNEVRTINAVTDSLILVDTKISTDLDGQNYSFPGTNVVEVGGDITARNNVDLQFIALSNQFNVESFEFRFNLTPNSRYENNLLGSELDGTEARFFTDELISQVDTGIKTFDQLGRKSGQDILLPTIQRLAAFVHEFEIQFFFQIPYFFTDVLNIEEVTFPFMFEGTESITPNFDFVAYPQAGDIGWTLDYDRGSPVIVTNDVGNVGWFDEVFNGQLNEVEIDNVEYEILGSPVDGIDIAQTTRVKFDVTNLTNTAGTNGFSFGVVYSPEFDDQWKVNDFPFGNNTLSVTSELTIMLDSVNYGFTGRLNADGAGADVQNLFVQIVDANTLHVEFEYVPNSAFEDYISAQNVENRLHFIYFSTASDRSALNAVSDRVTLLVDRRQFTENPVPGGPFNGMVTKFHEHPFDDAINGVANYTGFVEDDILANVTFRTLVPTVMDSISFGFEAVNTVDGRTFELDRNEIDTSNEIILPNLTHEVNLFNTRPFKYKSGNSKNFFNIIRNLGADFVAVSGTVRGYKGQYGFKLRWEDWLERSNVPGDFYDAALKQNGLNNDWAHFTNTTDWDVRFIVRMTLTNPNNNESESFRNEFPIEFDTFDTAEFVDSRIEHFDPAVVSLFQQNTDEGAENLILKDDFTTVRGYHELTNTEVWDLNKVYGTICIEIHEGSGQFTLYQISSVIDRLVTNNPLIPSDGETFATINATGDPKIIFVEARIDPDLLPTAAKFKVSSRIGCKPEVDCATFTRRFSCRWGLRFN